MRPAAAAQAVAWTLRFSRLLPTSRKVGVTLTCIRDAAGSLNTDTLSTLNLMYQLKNPKLAPE
jgi:hypothetical protein